MTGIRPHLVGPPHLPAVQNVTVRPIGPGDVEALQAHVRGLSPESRYNRFFAALHELSRAEVDRLTRLDQTCGLALLAEVQLDGAAIMIAEACYALVSERREAEFALSVADGWRRRGLGTLLVAEIERRSKALGARRLVGEVLRSNAPMKALAKKCGFVIDAAIPCDARLVRIEKDFLLSRGSPQAWTNTPGLATAA